MRLLNNDIDLFEEKWDIMTYWRMAMRIGNQGPSQWQDCLEKGIAAIGYYDESGELVVEDCRELTEREYDDIWRRKRPTWTVPRANLKKLAYEMQEGDTIYVKEGTRIVGKGAIMEGYGYDPNVLLGAQEPWEHYVTVDWQKDFIPFELKLGAEQNTILRLEGERLRILQEKESNIVSINRDVEVEEGSRHQAEVTFRKRNSTIIEAKKASSDYRCEVCGFKFLEMYGEIGRNYIIAHHLNPIGERDTPTITTIGDIALVCANCHAMIHKKNPPYTIEELKGKL
jgi:hypothetical protein